jgi:dipeptide/tripeptide permease
LDYAEAKHGKKLVMETKILLNVFVLYLPLPLFWALFEQQGSRWMIQATKMSGDLGFYTIYPDHMQVINPLLILLLIPLCDYVIYPILRFLRVRRPLQKMALGGTLAGVSFIISMIVQMKIDEASPEKLNMMWLVPQYVVMVMAEVMFSVTGLEFSFTQAPSSMKSVICACWLVSFSPITSYNK